MRFEKTQNKNSIFFFHSVKLHNGVSYNLTVISGLCIALCSSVVWFISWETNQTTSASASCAATRWTCVRSKGRGRNLLNLGVKYTIFGDFVKEQWHQVVTRRLKHLSLYPPELASELRWSKHPNLDTKSNYRCYIIDDQPIINFPLVHEKRFAMNI